LNFKLGCNLFSFFGLLKPIVLMVETISDIKGEQFMKVGKICGAWCYDQWGETRQRYQIYVKKASQRNYSSITYGMSKHYIVLKCKNCV
jgi:hypothetical protein